MSNEIFAKLMNSLDMPAVYGDRDGQYCLWFRLLAEDKRQFWRFDSLEHANEAVASLDSAKFAYVLRDGTGGEVLTASDTAF